MATKKKAKSKAKKAPKKVAKAAPKKAAPKKAAKKAAPKKKAGGAVRAVVKKVAKAAKRAAKKVAKAVAEVAAPQPVQGSIVHIEFYTPDLNAASTFWSQLAGWVFHPFQPTELYFHGPGNWGPGGCVIQGEPNMTGNPTLYVNVDDIPAILTRALTLGAELLKDKTEIPGGHGFYAHIKTPDGNVWGVYSRT